MNLGFWRTRIYIEGESNGVALSVDWWSVKRGSGKNFKDMPSTLS